MGEVGGCISGALKYYVLFGVAGTSGSSDPGCAGDVFAWAGGVVIRTRPEMVRVVGIEAVTCG